MGHVYNADDACVHLSWMRQAAEGRWLFSDRFTAETQQPQFFHLFFLLLGKIAGWFGGSYRVLLVVYHLARIVCGWALLLVCYLLAALVFRERETRRLALLIVGLSSGMGWFLNAVFGPGAYSVDFSTGLMMPETNTFLSLYLFPLFAASQLLLAGSYLLLLRAFGCGKARYAAGAGVLALVLGNIHSYDILPFYAVLAVYLVWLALSRRAFPLRELLMAGIAVLISLPGPLYQYLVFHRNPIFQAKALTPTLSPNLLQYAFTFGLVLLFAMVGAFQLRRQKTQQGAFLVIWAAVTLAMAYAPVSFQRKMIEGIHIPIALLAAGGWSYLGQRFATWRRYAVVWPALFLLLTVPSNIAVMAQSLQRLVNNNAEGAAGLLPPYYLDADERGGLDWLRAHTASGDVVLSSPLVGAYMPPYCGVTTYVSHWAETIRFQQKLDAERTFFAGYVPDAWRRQFL
ncbi:MAG TPA: hypothetical protein VHR86_07645, partial [Armatimonadota bacterium]|nr:hypothetical protein [Armatimonadota bacterium]